MLATLLALALCLSLLPMSALAAEADALGETGPEEAVCTCTVPCTEGGMNTACPVCGAEGAAPEDCGQSLPQGNGEAKTQPLANEGISLLSTQEDVSYIDPTEEQTAQTCNSATEVTADDTTWGDDGNNGWYVVNSNVTISDRVTVTGDVHLILADGCNLTVNRGINVKEGNRLTIYARSTGESMGTLIANAIWMRAAIGCELNQTAGEITICGGNIAANGGESTAIGGVGNESGIIAINGGRLSVSGGTNGAGGAGISGTVTINGGQMVVTGSTGCAGIDGTFSTGDDGNAVIVANSISDNDNRDAWSGLIITQTKDEGKIYGKNSFELVDDLEIPEGYTLTIEDDQTLIVPENVTLTNNGTIICDGTIEGDVGGTGNFGLNTYYLNADNTHVDVQAIQVTASSINWGANNSSAYWYVVNDNVTIDSRVNVEGDVHLILADGYNLTVNGGINVTGDNSLTIYGQSGGTGTLVATASNGAGIGGSDGEKGGTIIINGGTVNATGGSGGAGIGGGSGYWGNGSSGTIIINGGTVNATGVRGGAGIGGGRDCAGGIITINGGHVRAQGSTYSFGKDDYALGAGIGGSGGGDGGKITISGGSVIAFGAIHYYDYYSIVSPGIGGGVRDEGNVATGDFSTGADGNSVIIASSISDNEDRDAWSGLIITQTQDEGKIYGGNSFEIENDLEIPEGYTLTIENGKTLTISAGVTLTNNGTIICNGTINGSVDGDVRYPSGVTVAFSGEGVNTSTASYGSTIIVTATMQRAQTNGINSIAELGYVNFYLGDTSGTLLGTSEVKRGTGGTYTATLEVTLDDATNWIPNDTPYTITADFGGVAGTSGDGLISSTGTAELTVTKGNQTAPTAPTMSSRTTNSVTLNAISSAGQGAVQYGYVQGNSGTPTSWQDNTTFNGLSAGTDYTFYARYAGNDYYNESQVSGGTSVTTLPEISTTNLDAGYVGVPYSATLEANADSGKTVTWALATGSSLPNGLTLSNGTISGMPTKAVTDYTFTVQATINGEGDTQVTNSKELSITINQGTPVITATTYNGTTQTNTFDYGETITINGKITASNQAPNNGINSITEPEQNQVGLYLGDTQLATAEVTDGSFAITYETSKQGIQIGKDQPLTVKYGGSDDLNSGSTTVTITLNTKPVTATVTNTITKVYDGDTNAAVELAVASKDLVNGNDEITVTGTGTYNSADVGESIGVTVSNIQTVGDDSAWYNVSAPTGVTGAITKATQEAPNAPTVIERTSSSVTLAALGMTGQGALEYGYTTGAEGEPAHWQTGTTFTGLTSGTTYTFYARYSGDNNYSPAVSERGTEASTLSTTDPNVVNPGETVITDDGTKVTNDGEKITITPDDGGTTTTITPDDGTTVNGDGTVNVPDGSTVQTGDGPEMTLPGGGTIDPDTGAITPDEGGSVVIDTGDGTTTITPPSGQPVTPNDDGSVTIPGGSTVTGSDGERVTIPPEGGTLQPGGEVKYTVTVTFDSQGGSQVPSQDITVGEPVSQPDDPTRTGYRFLGWYTAATGGAHWDFTQPVTGDQTLYAQWAYLPPPTPTIKSPSETQRTAP